MQIPFHFNLTFFGTKSCTHDIVKSQKKSHSTLRVQQTTLTFRTDKSSLKMVNFGDFLKPKGCGQTVLAEKPL